MVSKFDKKKTLKINSDVNLLSTFVTYVFFKKMYLEYIYIYMKMFVLAKNYIIKGLLRTILQHKTI